MDSETNSWESVVDYMIGEIQKGNYTKGQRLPSENEMAVQFGVTRADIRKAYERLKELGLVCSSQGRGSFFEGIREVIPLRLRGGSFSSKMKELGLPYESMNIRAAVIRYNPIIHGPLRLGCDEAVWEVVRLRVISGEPVAIHSSFLPQKWFPDLPSKAASITSVFEYLEQSGYAGHKGRDTQLRVGTLTANERKLLKVRGYASCLIYTGHRLSSDESRVLELMRTVYRADRFSFLL
jgi:GntR family transcriptional regulator